MDDCKKQLRDNVRAIVAMLESPPDVMPDDGTPMEEVSGTLWDADDEVWRDEDGDEMEVEQLSGYGLLNDALDVEYTIGSTGDYLGARVCMTCGGPGIWIDTRRNVVAGYWAGDRVEMSYTDSIRLDDACEELFREMQS